MSLDYGDQFDNGYMVRWNASSLEAFDKCPRYFQYTILEKWEPLIQSEHLWFGDLFARSMQTYHEHRFAGASHDDAVIEAVHSTMMLTWDREKGKPIDYEEVKNRFNLIRTIVWYFEEYRRDLKVAVINGKPALELKVEADIGVGLSLIGKLDRAYLYDENIMVMDQKTTKTTISPHYWKQWKPKIQMSQYSFLGQVVFQSETPPGVLIDAAQIAVGFTRFARQPTFRTPAELEEFLGEAKATINAAVDATDKKHFRRNTASCGNYGGCAFRDICSKSPEARKTFLKGAFKQKG